MVEVLSQSQGGQNIQLRFYEADVTFECDKGRILNVVFGGCLGGRGIV